MEQPEVVLKQTDHLLTGFCIHRLAKGGFYDFQQPGTKILPNQFISSHKGIRYPVFGEMVFDLLQGSGKFGAVPPDAEGSRFGLIPLRDLPTLYQAEGIPDLVCKILALLAEPLVKEEVIPGSGAQ